jgi:hypothetical protein
MNLLATVASTLHSGARGEENTAPCVLLAKYTTLVVTLTTTDMAENAGATSTGTATGTSTGSTSTGTATGTSRAPAPLRVAPALFAAVLGYGRVGWLSHALLGPLSQLLAVLDQSNVQNSAVLDAEQAFRFKETTGFHGGGGGPHFSDHDRVRVVNDGRTVVKTGNQWCTVAVGEVVTSGRQEMTLRVDKATVPHSTSNPGALSSLIVGVCSTHSPVLGGHAVGQGGVPRELRDTQSWGWISEYNSPLHAGHVNRGSMHHQLRAGDVVKMIVDADEGTLTFVINGNTTVHAFGPVREICIIVHVGGTRCVTSSTDHCMKIHARRTLSVEFIRTRIFLFLFYV